MTYDSTDYDITDSVMLNKKHTMLIVSYNIEKINQKNSEKLKNWINLADKYNINPYLVTSSDSKLVEQQLNNYKLKIPYAFADDIA